MGTMMAGGMGRHPKHKLLSLALPVYAHIRSGAKEGRGEKKGKIYILVGRHIFSIKASYFVMIMLLERGVGNENEWHIHKYIQL